MKKLLALSVASFFSLLLALWLVVPLVRAKNPVTLHLFYAEGCPHCRDEKEFLAKILPNYPDLEIRMYEVSKERSAAILMGEVGKALNTSVGGVPFTVVGDKFVIGFGSAQTSGQQIEQLIKQQELNQTPDVVKSLLITATPVITPLPTPTTEVVQEKPEPVADSEQTTTVLDSSIEVPIVGSVSIKSLSLPVLTVLIGFLDGFNPCAMWVLLFLISLLLGMHDRKRMWILGTTFIVASGFVYFLFMTAWLNFFLLLGYIQLTRMLIGVFAIGVGVYQLRDFYINRDGACKVVPTTKRKPWLERMKKIVVQKQLLLAMMGMAGLAAAVNVVELACSAGLPAIYTQVLAVSGLATWQHYALLLLYIVIFMIDDILIFVIAMKTLQITGIQHKYARYSHLIGGFVIFLLGLLLVFKPEWLLFG